MGRVYVPSLVTSANCTKRREKCGRVGESGERGDVDVDRARGEMWAGIGCG